MAEGRSPDALPGRVLQGHQILERTIPFHATNLDTFQPHSNPENRQRSAIVLFKKIRKSSGGPRTIGILLHAAM